MIKRIVIASVLKPVDDVRAYEKIAQSIAKTNKYHVNIIGNGGKINTEDKRISSHSHFIDSNSVLNRLIIRAQILFKILSQRPHLLIITTHELLNVALLIKLLIGCKIIYDVQENHLANIKHINPTWIKRIYSKVIKLKESTSRLFISQYWLAEACYKDELSFVKNRFLILENKAKNESKIRENSDGITLLFSGTISNYSGVKNAIHILEKIQEKQPSASLKIIGQIHDEKLENQLVEIQESVPNIELNISKNPIPHSAIIDSIFESNYGIIGYEINDVNKEKIPTKLYEYSRYQLPFFVLEKTKWSEIGGRLGGAIPVNFSSLVSEEILIMMENTNKLFSNRYPNEETWEYESKKMIDFIDTLI